MPEDTRMKLCPAEAGDKLAVGVLGRLNAHVRLSFVHATLPLPALLLHRRLSAVLGVHVGQVGGGVVVRLQGVVVLDLQGDGRRGRG